MTEPSDSHPRNGPAPAPAGRPQDDLRAGPIVIAGIVGSVLVFALIVALSALFISMQESEATRKASGKAPNALRRLRAEQVEKLTTYAVDPSTGAVRIPVTRAMELLVREAAERK